MSKKTTNNQQQQQKYRVEPVDVYCRIRPLNNNESNENQQPQNEKCLKVLDEQTLMLQIPECSATYRSGQIKQLVYSFNRIYDETINQNELFDQTCFPLVQDLILGKNGVLFTYGVTGSGKTYTMMGNTQEPGLLQRTLDTLFNSITNNQAKRNTFKTDKLNSFELNQENQQQQKIYPLLPPKTPSRIKAQADTIKLNECSNNNRLCDINDTNTYSIYISACEIYNNYIYDLLEDKRDESKILKEDTKGQMYIKDINEIEVKTTEEALELVYRAFKKRVVAHTDLNQESSRSHSIFTIRCLQANLSDTTTNNNNNNRQLVQMSQLSLVDLAGCERTKRTKNTGSRLKEAGNINSSLMALRNCIEALKDNNKIIPYRDSKLTLLFKNYFEGNGNIKMILCINPSELEFDETINVLKFSDQVKDVLIPVTSPIDSRPALSKQTSIDNEQLNEFLSNFNINNYSSQNDVFPSIDLQSCQDDITIKRLIEHLEDRQKKREALIHETQEINKFLFQLINNLIETNDKLLYENQELKQRIELKERNENKMDSKIRALEKVINKTPFNNNLKEVNELIERRKFKDIENINPTLISSNNNSQTPTYRSNKLVHLTPSSGTSASSNGRPQVPLLPPLSTPSSIASHTTSSAKVSSIYTQHLASQQQHQNYLRSPIRRDGIPVGNRRAQRRSKSADMWLDHKPPTITKTDTVLQPKMTRKRSVSRVELNDAKKSTKYLLTHQQQDNDGELITNLIRGDILKSPSGGANVIFTDIETLKQQDMPLAKKRRSTNDGQEGLFSDRATIEDRCSVAIEGHSARTPRQTIKLIK